MQFCTSTGPWHRFTASGGMKRRQPMLHRRSSVAKSSFPGKCGRDSTRVLRERVYLRYSKDTAGIPAILRVFPGNYPRCIPGVPGIPGIGQIPGDSCGDRPPRFSQLLEEWRFLRPRSPTLLLRFPICFPPALALQGILSVPFYLVAVPASRLRRCRFVIIFCKPVPFLASGGLDFTLWLDMPQNINF